MRAFKALIAWILAIVIAFVGVNLVLSFYYRLPSKLAVTGGATHQIWQPNKDVYYGIEGYAKNKTDENGYNNPPGILPAEHLILFLGSSHVQGFHVAPEENATFIFNELSEKYTLYNAGMDAHGFVDACQNLRGALRRFSPEKIVVEINKVYYTKAQLEPIKPEEPLAEYSESGGSIVSLISSLPFIRLAYRQLIHYWSDVFKPDIKKAFIDRSDSKEPGEHEADYEDNMRRVLSYVGSTADVTFVYQPYVVLEDGEAVIKPEAELAVFRRLCEEYGIGFIDMSDAFCKLYYEKHVFPHGFSNTEVALGHLNRYGHEAIAHALYDYYEGGEGK